MAAPPDTGFIAIHGNRLEDLRQSLITFLRSAPLDPFDEDVILVQSNGIAQWLKQSIATNPANDLSGGGLGIAVDLDFKLPSEFIWKAYRSVLSEAEVPKSSPFDKRPLSWRLFALLPKLLEQPVYQPLKRFIEGPEPKIRTFQLAEKLADLFDQYQVYRADWLANWESNSDSIFTSNGVETILAKDELWQPALWRAICDDIRTNINADAVNTSRSRVHLRFMKAASQINPQTAEATLPKRVFVFGVSSLPRQTLEALAALSRFSQVIFCVLNPSKFHWAEIVSDRELLTAERRRGLIKDGFAPGCELTTLHGHANPLLAGWGKQGRDFLRMLDEFDETTSRASAYALYRNEIDLFFEHSDPATPSLLNQLQDDIFLLTDLDEIKREDRTLDPGEDHSVGFHIAHSPLREVEILHDQLLAVFNTDSTIQPRDVMVMVPDINVYAPFIKAVFSQPPRDSALHIPFNIADLGQRGQNPLLSALEILLSLPQGRCSVSEVMSLLEAPALRNRFKIAEQDLELIAQWIEATNIRWGLDAAQRQNSDHPAIGNRNTWLAGIQSMLVGFSLGRHEAWMEVQGYAEIGGTEIAIAGNLCAFVEALQALADALGRPLTGSQWVAQIHELVERFFAAEDPADELLVDRIGDQLSRWRSELEIAGALDEEIPLLIARERVMSSLDETNLRQRFLSGSVNFSTLMPMRSIPFKMICLLGMNDGDYPRSRVPMDFDLMAREYRPGDRSRRNDDRYLFLEALLSARRKLYISWVGRSILDDSERPASVLVEQLREYIDTHWRSIDATTDTKVQTNNATTDQLLRVHPLQPFSRAYYPSENSADSLIAALKERRLFTFNQSWRQALAQSDRHFTDSKCTLSYIQPQEPLSFRTLKGFLKNPIAHFYNHRLGIWFDDLNDADSDNEIFSLSHLQKAVLESELIEQVVLKSRSVEEFEQRLEHQLNDWGGAGRLGIDSMEQYLRAQASSTMPDLFSRSHELQLAWPTYEPDLNFTYSYSDESGHVELADRITGLRRNALGERARVHISRSKLLDGQNRKRVRYEQLLGEYLIHLCGQLDGQGFESLILSKEESCCIALPRMAVEEAQPLLNTLLASWMQAMTEPLPALPQVAYEYLEWIAKGNRQAARTRAQAKYQAQLDDYDRGYLARAYPSFEQLYDNAAFSHLCDDLYGPLRTLHLRQVEEISG